MRQVRWFSSNHHAAFGRLLTPIVGSIRIIWAVYAAVQPKATKARVAGWSGSWTYA